MILIPGHAAPPFGRRRVAGAALALFVAFAACSGDAEEATDQGGGGSDPNLPDIVAEGITVTLAAESRQEGELFVVTADFTVTNTTEGPVFMEDVTGRRSAQRDGATLRTRYGDFARRSNSGGDAPLPPHEGIILDAGASVSGETGHGASYGELPTPTEMEVCIEILTNEDDFYVADDGDAQARRVTISEPVVACSGVVPIVAG
ncbi:MAG: hypothetical protein WKF93_12300 [Acidimicrobiales bacterium]